LISQYSDEAAGQMTVSFPIRGMDLCAIASRPPLGPTTHPPIQWVPGVKWLGHKAEHWSCTSTPPLMSYTNLNFITQLYLCTKLAMKLPE